MRENRHVSEDEKKKNFLIVVLLVILIAIIITTLIVIMIPKIRKLTETPDVPKDSNVVKKVVEGSSDTKIVEDADKNINRDESKVTIIVNKESLTPDAAVITITDKNKNKYSWSPLYKIQQKVDGKWEDMALLNPENMMLPDIAYDNESGVMTQSLVWGNKYGSLKKGEYRIVKESDGTEFYAEFRIN